MEDEPLVTINKFVGKTSTLGTQILCCILTGIALRSEPLIIMLENFVDSNEDPRTSPHFRTTEADDLRPLATLLADSRCRNNDRLITALLRTFKIASRKVSTRSTVDGVVLKAVLLHLKAPRSGRIAREAASVILNACYEKRHVMMVVSDGAVEALVSFLAAEDTELQAAAAGALQSICFQEGGKAAARESGAIPELVVLLSNQNAKLAARAAGALHNLSADVLCIPIIRLSGGIQPLVALLRASSAASAGSAAGAIQNLSRENACRDLIRESDAVAALADLLFGSDLGTAVTAVGALLNILGPDYGAPTDDNEERRAFRKLLGMSLAMGAAYHGLFTPDTS